MVLSRLDDALDAVPSGGLAYLPTASYREMESWSLPPDAALRLARLERDLGEERVAGPDGALLRGAHWRNFLVKYPESNRMHKKMMALSALARRRGDPPAVRRAIGRAQCNDAYWHGVFGGLYLPHLRDAVWRNLAEAEAALREGEGLAWDVLDLDGDGNDEVWVHSRRLLRARQPGQRRRDRGVHPLRRGHQLRQRPDPPAGGLSRSRARAGRRAGRRTRRHGEHSRHRGGPPARVAAAARRRRPRAVRGSGAAPRRYARRLCPRSILDHPVLGPVPVRVRRRAAKGRGRDRVHRPRGTVTAEKRIRCEADGRIAVSWTWDPAVAEPGDSFATELSLAGPVQLQGTPAPEEWRFEIETVAKSERGLDRTRQGESVTLRWPVELGAASVEFRALGRD